MRTLTQPLLPLSAARRRRALRTHRAASRVAAALLGAAAACAGQTLSGCGADGGAVCDGAAAACGDGPDTDAGPGPEDGSPAQPDAGPACPEGYGGPPTSSGPPLAGTWTLTFQDDFLGETLDDSKWKVGQHVAFFNGIAGNSPEQLALGCGYLTFTAEKRANTWTGQSRAYVSAEMTTFKRFRQRHGYFEARLKFDGIQGLWPAFWLMPDRGTYGDVDQNRISYLKFDLTADGHTTVVSAVLELHVDAAESGVQNVVLVRVADDSWSESTITWNTRPAVDPLWLEMRWDPAWAAGATVQLDVTEYVNRELAGDRVVSFALQDGFERARRVSFASKESPTAAHRPRLVLDGTSVPVIEDAAVGEGTFADQNLGADPLLPVNEEWQDASSTYDGGMEFDIMESLGHWGADMTQHALHWDGYDADHRHAGSGHLGYAPTADGFHVYGMNWQPGLVQFYVDGTKTWEWADARVGSVAEYILLSLQIGGWSDDLGSATPPDDAALPGRLIIDWVRVFSGSP